MLVILFILIPLRAYAITAQDYKIVLESCSRVLEDKTYDMDYNFKIIRQCVADYINANKSNKLQKCNKNVIIIKRNNHL